MTTIPQLTGRELLRLMCRVRGVAPQVLDDYTLDDDNNENDNSKNINIYNDNHHNNHKDNDNNQKNFVVKMIQ